MSFHPQESARGAPNQALLATDGVAGLELFRSSMFRDVRLLFEDPLSFLREYDEHISQGALFLPGKEEFTVGDLLDVTLDLAFCFRAVRVLGVVAQRITGPTSILLDRQPGVVVKLADGLGDLRELLRDTFSDQSLEGGADTPPSTPDSLDPNRRVAPRFEMTLPGHIRRGSDSVQAITKNVSDSGALLRVSGMDLTPGDQVSLGLVNPKTGNLVVLAARVVRQDGEPAQPNGVAVEFQGNPKPDRDARSFLDQMRAISQARKPGGMSGNLSGLTLPALLQSLASSATMGTLDIVWDRMEAHILFQNGGLRHARLGRVEGLKALARLFSWRNGEFNFQPQIEPDEPSQPIIPIAQAVIEAMHQFEELERLGSRKVDPTLVLERTGHLCGYRLGEVEASVLEFIDRPMCVEPILDAFPEPDAEIHRAIAQLISANLLRTRD